MIKRLPRSAPPPLQHDALLQMLEHNPWVPNALHRDGLISWRHYAAAALRDVSIGSMAEMFCDVIDHLEQLTAKRLIEQIEDDPPVDGAFGIGDWYDVWHQHFVSWQDPVRDLLCSTATTPDARDFAQRLPMADPEVLLDFMLDAHLAWSELQNMVGRAGLPQHPAVKRFPLTLPADGKERPLFRLYRALFERFAEQVPFQVELAPERIFLFSDFSRLFPPEPAWTRETSIRGQA